MPDTETEYAVEPAPGRGPHCVEDKLAAAMEMLPHYGPTAKLITRQITYGPWRYVSPEEIRNA